MVPAPITATLFVMIFPTFVTAGLGSAIPPGVAPCLPKREIPPNAGAEEYYGGPPGKGTGSVVSGYRGTSVRERQAPMRAMTVAISLFLASLPAAAQDQSKGLPGQTAPSSPAPMTARRFRKRRSVTVSRRKALCRLPCARKKTRRGVGQPMTSDPFRRFARTADGLLQRN